MPSKTITISAAKWTRVKEAIKGHDPIPTNEEGKLSYTDAEWVFVKIKKYIARVVRSYEQNKQGKDNAPAYDEDIVTIE